MTKNAQAVLITGAAKRVGAAVAIILAEQGYDVILHYNQSVQAVWQLQQQVQRLGRQAYLIQQHFTAKTDFAAFISQAYALHPHVVALVNNASIFSYDTPATTTAATLLSHFEANTLVPTLLTQHFVENAMAHHNQARVINVLDNKVAALNPDYFAYTLSKANLKTATEMLAMHYGSNAYIYGVAPSMMLESGAKTEGRVDALTAINVLNKNITPLDLSYAIVFLLQGSMASGKTLLVDGGQSLLNLPRDVAYLSSAHD